MSDFGISSRFELAVVDYTAQKFPVLIRTKIRTAAWSPILA